MIGGEGVYALQRDAYQLVGAVLHHIGHTPILSKISNCAIIPIFAIQKKETKQWITTSRISIDI